MLDVGSSTGCLRDDSSRTENNETCRASRRFGTTSSVRQRLTRVKYESTSCTTNPKTYCGPEGDLKVRCYGFIRSQANIQTQRVYSTNGTSYGPLTHINDVHNPARTHSAQLYHGSILRLIQHERSSQGNEWRYSCRVSTVATWSDVGLIYNDNERLILTSPKLKWSQQF